MRGLNKVTLIGNVGKDPETQVLDGGIYLAKFTLATSESYKEKKGNKHTETERHNIITWRGVAEVADKYLKKGSSVYLEGKIKTSTFENKVGVKKQGTEIIAEQLILLDKANGKPSEIKEIYASLEGVAQTGMLGAILRNHHPTDDNTEKVKFAITIDKKKWT